MKIYRHFITTFLCVLFGIMPIYAMKKGAQAKKDQQRVIESKKATKAKNKKKKKQAQEPEFGSELLDGKELDKEINRVTKHVHAIFGAKAATSPLFKTVTTWLAIADLYKRHNKADSALACIKIAQHWSNLGEVCEDVHSNLEVVLQSASGLLHVVNASTDPLKALHKINESMNKAIIDTTLAMSSIFINFFDQEKLPYDASLTNVTLISDAKLVEKSIGVLLSALKNVNILRLLVKRRHWRWVLQRMLY